jgi:hypothetical protein
MARQQKSGGLGLWLAVAAGIALAGAGSHAGHHIGHGVEDALAAAPAGGTPGNVALGRRMAARLHWTGSQWTCLDVLWEGESGWRVNADTRASGLDPADATVYAYGIPQARPAQKMATAGANWRTSARTQIRWGLRYIKRTYDTPCSALAFKRSSGNKGY